MLLCHRVDIGMCAIAPLIGAKRTCPVRELDSAWPTSGGCSSVGFSAGNARMMPMWNIQSRHCIRRPAATFGSQRAVAADAARPPEAIG
jgi:hypothetical protein